MSYQITKRHIVNTLVSLYEQYNKADFSSRQVMDEVHKRTFDVLYQLQLSGLIDDYYTHITFKDRSNEMAGYEVEITICENTLASNDNFVLFVMPALNTDDPVSAYDRAMRII